MEKSAICKTVTKLCVWYGKKEDQIPETILDIYYKYISENLTEEEFKSAIAQVVINCQFMPTPKQIVELVKGNQESLKLQEAHIEWESIVKIASGPLDKELNLPAVTAWTLKNIGGIRSIALAGEKELEWKKKEFLKLYQSVNFDVQKTLPKADESVSNLNLTGILKSMR